MMRLVQANTASDAAQRHTGANTVPQDFALYVRERMPEWVKDVIRNASPRRTEDYNDLRKELQELLNKYKVRIPGRRLTGSRWPTIGRANRLRIVWSRRLWPGHARNPGARRNFQL